MSEPARRQRVVILGAAGRDFHTFHTVYRDAPDWEVVAFTAAQIPGIAGRRYPARLAGAGYPDGIPIVAEHELEALCGREGVDTVVLAYSDLAHADAMHLASRALATGADFVMHGPRTTMLRAAVPVIAVSAVRTGCGKSQTARFVGRHLAAQGLRIAALRHPMPYGALEAQAVQRFAARADLERAACTVEEREEYEPWIAAGIPVFAGIDYAAILRRAEAEAQVIVWDGGNNDFPFVTPDLHLVLVDALRPDQVDTHHPGETVLRMADVVVVNKVDAAPAHAVRALLERVRALRPGVPVLRTGSPARIEDPARVHGRRVLVVEDGPTLLHGGMAYGAGFVAAVGAGAELVDPRASATPEIAALFASHPGLGPVLPAAGYDAAQREALRRTIEASEAEFVVAGTPIDLAAVLGLAKPVVRVSYQLADLDRPGLAARLDDFLVKQGLRAA